MDTRLFTSRDRQGRREAHALLRELFDWDIDASGH